MEIGKVKIKARVRFSVPVELTEGEVRGLDAICGYGIDEFLKCFYAHMGKHYLEPHENSVRELFEKVRSLRPVIHDIDEARKNIHLKPMY